ncbi:MAG TPA: LLM class flavin-dependent oxidoreductase, partial [Actinomycetota bacterium]|nr:LLM class flavin-dependent oxidoreductase [Actinomycetota bacterium]
MRIGVGLPNVIPGASHDDLVDWARRAEDHSLTSIGALHRASWDVHDPLDSLSLVATETARATLVTMVAVGPLYATEELVQRARELHENSRNRLVLGLAVGARVEDFEAAGVPHQGRGERFDDQLDALALTRVRSGGPPVMVGGSADVAFARAARAGAGYVHGGGPPRAFSRAADKARAAWIEAGRPGMPELWGQSYFTLGDEEA